MAPSPRSGYSARLNLATAVVAGRRHQASMHYDGRAPLRRKQVIPKEDALYPQIARLREFASFEDRPREAS
jgi:hypothetical protein